MRLGIVLVTKPYAGGAFTYAAFMLEAISRANDSISEIVAYYTDNLWEKYLDRYSNIKGVLLEGEYLEKIDKLSNSSCDIILLSDQLNWCRDISIPTITPIHDLMHIYERGNGFPEIEDNDCFTFRQWLYTDIYSYSAGILTDSELGRKQVLDQYGRVKEDRVYALPFSVPFYLNKQYGKRTSPISGKYIFYPAQFWKHKNHEALVKAVAKLKAKSIPIKLVFVGSDKGNLENIKRLMDDNSVTENIEVLGFVPDDEMYMLYKNARAMVMPSIFGPTNIPPLEAMYMGCPVAVSDNYAMPEQIGNAGLTFDPYNIDEIADVLEQLWCDDNLCNQLSIKGKKQIEKFSIDVFSSRLLSYIEDVYRKEHEFFGEIREFITKCKEKECIYIYGAGEYARYVFGILNYYGVAVKGFVVSDAPKIGIYLGLPVISIEAYKYEADNTIVLGLHPKHYEAVLYMLGEHNIPKQSIWELSETYLRNMRIFFTTAHGKTCLELVRKYD